jgi:hypothetical protein
MRSEGKKGEGEMCKKKNSTAINTTREGATDRSATENGEVKAMIPIVRVHCHHVPKELINNERASKVVSEEKDNTLIGS